MKLCFATSRRSIRIIPSSILLLNLIILILLAKIFYPSSNKVQWGEEQFPITEQLAARVYINDSLPHYQYKRIRDSITQKIKFENIDNFYPGDGWSFLNISASTVRRAGNPKHYLSIPGYYKTDMAYFYTKDGKDYLRYTIWRTKETDSTGGMGEIIDKEMTMRFIRPNTKEQEYIIGIPLSKSAFKVWRVIIIALSISIAIMAFYSLIFIPYKLLKLIARGEAFNDETIGSLYTIGGFLIFLGLLISFIRIIAHIYLASSIPSPFTYYIYDDLMSQWLMIVIGLVVLLFAKAFQKGYQLQEEQELTV